MFERKPARIGQLHFKYDDPAVDVTSEKRTVEHETMDDTVVVQTLGRRADQITVTGIVADWELIFVDDLSKNDVLSLRTERWSGDVVVTSTDTTYRRELDGSGNWLYDVTIDCLEVDRYESTVDRPDITDTADLAEGTPPVER